MSDGKFNVDTVYGYKEIGMSRHRLNDNGSVTIFTTIWTYGRDNKLIKREEVEGVTYSYI